METVTLSLEKGAKVDLTKGNSALKKIAMGLGWDPKDTGQAFDLDASAILLDGNRKLLNNDPGSILYFGSPLTNANPANPKELGIHGGALVHSGDNLTGEGAGDDETITIDLAKVPAGTKEIIFVVNIFKAVERGQNFGQVRNTHARVLNAETGEELKTADGKPVRFDMSEDASTATGMIICSVYEKDGEWKFNAVGEGKTGDLNQIIASYA